MDTNELKFLLKLLGFANYRAELSAFSSTKSSNPKKICKDLGERNLVDYTREIAKVKISPSGQELLKLNRSQLPITDKELKVLEKIGKASGKVTPSKIKIKPLKAAERDDILKILSERGFIEVDLDIKKNKPEVWLTERGIESLRDDYNPNKGVQPVISLELLGNYLRFLRKILRIKPEPVTVLPPTDNDSDTETVVDISDEEILQIIEKLDRELETENYLPIFHLRQKLQPPMSRDDLDQALYRLQKNDQIELRSLVHAQDYTSEQVNAGISQRSGSPLFFIKLIEN